jgi:hypothetical protein
MNAKQRMKRRAAIGLEALLAVTEAKLATQRACIALIEDSPLAVGANALAAYDKLADVQAKLDAVMLEAAARAGRTYPAESVASPMECRAWWRYRSAPHVPDRRDVSHRFDGWQAERRRADVLASEAAEDYAGLND